MKRRMAAFLALFLAAVLSGCGNGIGSQDTQTRSEKADHAVEAEPLDAEKPTEKTTEEADAGLTVFQDGIERAESVLPYDGGLLISNFGGQNGGYILYRKDGVTETLIPPGNALTMPTGMAVKDQTLFVCDGDRVRVFDLKQPDTEARTIRFAEAGHLANDTAVYGDTLYITVTDQDRIYRLDISDISRLGESVPVEWATVPGPNGIAVAGGVVYIASIPHDYATPDVENVIYRIRDWNNPVPEVVVDEPGLYDGIAVSEDGETLYYSDWNTAAVSAFHVQTGKQETLYQEAGMGPADIVQEGGVLYVPDLPGSRILELRTDTD